MSSVLQYDAPLRYDTGNPYDGVLVSQIPACDDFPGVLNEFDVWITPDGIEYDLHGPPIKAVVSDSGTGIPPLQFITQRGPYQDGVTVKGIFLQPRIVTMVIRQNAQSRTAWYILKNLLMDAMRPNRTPTGESLPRMGSLRKYMPNGTYLQVDCIAQKGPVFEARNLSAWDEWAISETIQFFCPDPTYYYPVLNESIFANPVAQLVFPITFPIVFGALDVTHTLTYEGTWPTFPTVTFTGPISGPTITNESTGETLSLDYTLNAGQTATFLLPYGLKSVMTNDGINLAPYLTDASDLATFHIAPDPEVPGGINTMHAYGIGTDVGAQITMSWLDRYIGLTIRNVVGGTLA